LALLDIYFDTYRKSENNIMPQTAKIFTSGRSQAVRLPLKYRFNEKEVYIRRDEVTGDVILSCRPDSWAGLFALDATTDVPSDFMSEADRSQGEHLRDPFSDIPA
jgi:antitoxin VapB